LYLSWQALFFPSIFGFCKIRDLKKIKIGIFWGWKHAIFSGQKPWVHLGFLPLKISNFSSQKRFLKNLCGGGSIFL
jgi:hypothetical protein